MTILPNLLLLLLSGWINLPFAKKSKNMPMKSNSPVKVFLPMVPMIAKISLPAALIHSAATRVLIVFLSLARSATKPEGYAMVVIRKALASSQSDFIQPKEPKRNINIGFPILVRVSILLTQN